MSDMRLRARAVTAGLTVAVGAAAVIALPGAASGAALSGPQVAASSTAANQLDGVSCPAVRECVAVGSGQAGEGGREAPLAEKWNGTTWKAVTPPLPAGGVTGDLDAVSCPTTTECVAVGGYMGQS